jgi:hypothetical protein
MLGRPNAAAGDSGNEATPQVGGQSRCDHEFETPESALSMLPNTTVPEQNSILMNIQTYSYITVNSNDTLIF